MNHLKDTAKKKADEEPIKKKKKSTGVSVIDMSEAKPLKKKKPSATAITVNRDDYIAVIVGKKPALCFAHNPQRSSAYLVSTLDTDEPQVVEYSNETLLANFGPKPKFGKAYGFDIEPKLGEFDSEIGHVNLYRELNDAERKAVTSAIRVVHKRFAQKGVADIFPITEINIRNPKGKWAGSYKVVFKDGVHKDTVQLHPKIIEDAKYNLYIFAHEAGHAIWYRKLNDKYRALWLELYNAGVKVDHAKKQQMGELYKSLLDSQLSVREFMKDVEEDDAKLFREALSYLKKYHKLTPEDVNLLLNNNSRVLGEIWPQYGTTADIGSLVSEYACVSPSELFAESCAFYFSGKILPKSVKSLLDKTLKFIGA